MAMSSLPQPRDNLLENLRILVEERKEEIKEVYLEMRTALEQCEERVSKELCEIYSDTRERVGRDERKIGKLETAKGNIQTDLVDNEFNSILQTTVVNFDAQIAEIRRTSVSIPRYVELEWNKEELKKSIERVCKIVSSNCDARKTVQTSDAISHPNEEKRVMVEQVRLLSVYIHVVLITYSQSSLIIHFCYVQVLYFSTCQNKIYYVHTHFEFSNCPEFSNCLLRIPLPNGGQLERTL